MIELRVLTQDWTNPSYDRRVKYSSDAIAKLPAGTKITARPSTADRDPAVVEAVGIKFYTTGKFADQLIALSTPCTPSSWNEFRLLNGDSREGHWSGEQVLTALWLDPATRSAVESAFHKANAE